jgi:hypothetical protein
MKRILFLLLMVLMIAGCATDSQMLVRMNQMEEDLEILKASQGQAVGPIINQEQLKDLAAKGAAVKIRGFTDTTGGGAGALDAIGCATPAAGDLAMVFDTGSNVITFHKFLATDTTCTPDCDTEQDPEYIHPDDRLANCDDDEVWELFSGFRYIASATPTVNFRDSDNDDIETIIAKIYSNATATGTGAEIADLTLQVMVDGTNYKTHFEMDGDGGPHIFYQTASHVADEGYSGIVIADINAGETILAGQIVYWDKDDAEWMLADADVAGEFPARGMAVEACSNGSACKVLVNGWVKNDIRTLDEFGEAGTLYLSDTPGGVLDATAAAANLVTTGDCVQVIGWAKDADEAFFNFSGHWMEVE